MALQKTPLLTETTNDLITKYLKDNFNLFLKEVDFQYQDGISLEQIDDTSYHISDLIETLTLPCIYVLSGPHAFQYTENPNYLQSDDEIVVVLTAEEIGLDSLTRKVWRYGRVLFASLNLIDLGDSAGRIKLKTVPTRLAYTKPITSKLKKEEQRFRADVVLELKVLHYENNLT